MEARDRRRGGLAGAAQARRRPLPAGDRLDRRAANRRRDARRARRSTESARRSPPSATRRTAAPRLCRGPEPLDAARDRVDQRGRRCKVRWETLEPGPVGEYLAVDDMDATGKTYAPVDLNDPRLLAQDGWAPSEGNPQFHQQMVYAVAMKTIEHFERALGRPVLWRPAPNPANAVRRQRLRPAAARSARTRCGRPTPSTARRRSRCSSATSRPPPTTPATTCRAAASTPASRTTSSRTRPRTRSSTACTAASTSRPTSTCWRSTRPSPTSWR